MSDEKNPPVSTESQKDGDTGDFLSIFLSEFKFLLSL